MKPSDAACTVVACRMSLRDEETPAIPLETHAPVSHWWIWICSFLPAALGRFIAFSSEIVQYKPIVSTENENNTHMQVFYDILFENIVVDGFRHVYKVF